MAIQIGRSTGQLYDIAGPAVDQQLAYTKLASDRMAAGAREFNRSLENSLDQFTGVLGDQQKRKENLSDIADTRQFSREQAAQQQEYAIAGEGRKEVSMMGQNVSKKLSSVFEFEREAALQNRTFDEPQQKDRQKWLKTLNDIDADPTLNAADKWRQKERVIDEKLLPMTPWTPIQTARQVFDQGYADVEGFGKINPTTKHQVLPSSKNEMLTEQMQQATIRKNGTDAAHKAYEITGDIDYANAVGRNNDPDFLPLPETSQQQQSIFGGTGGGGGSRGSKGGQQDIFSRILAANKDSERVEYDKDEKKIAKRDTLKESFEKVKELDELIQSEMAKQEVKKQPDYMQPIPPPIEMPSTTGAGPQDVINLPPDVDQQGMPVDQQPIPPETAPPMVPYGNVPRQQSFMGGSRESAVQKAIDALGPDVQLGKPVRVRERGEPTQWKVAAGPSLQQQFVSQSLKDAGVPVPSQKEQKQADKFDTLAHQAVQSGNPQLGGALQAAKEVMAKYGGKRPPIGSNDFTKWIAAAELIEQSGVGKRKQKSPPAKKPYRGVGALIN